MRNAKPSHYTEHEERLHVWTHGLAFLVSLLSGGKIIIRNMEQHTAIGWLTGLAVFTISMSMVFFSSAMYHRSKDLKWRLHLRTLDHMSIYLLIAGTNTPIVMKYVPHPWDYYYLTAIWIVAISGIVAKLFFYSFFEKYDLGYYVMMGLLGGGIVLYCLDRFPYLILTALLGGGICYLIGVLFYRMKHMKYHHVFWHLWVINGAAFHYWAVWMAMG